MCRSSLVEKRKQWLEALTGDDKNAIVNQLTQMAWDAASFRVINEARRLAPADPDGGVQLNGLMHRLLDRGFFIAQMVAIRRLNDTFPLEGAKGTYSLTGLLKGISKHRHLLTRKAIFEAEDLKYDYEGVRQAADKYSADQISSGKDVYYIPKDLDWGRCELRHERIDQLAGVSSCCRCPRDLIREDVLANLTKKVESACADVITHVNKFIAHAAAPDSRQLANADELGITLRHVQEAHRHLCQVTGFLAIEVLGSSCPPFLAICQFDQFKHIEKPLIDLSNVVELDGLWHQFGNDCYAWSQWGFEQYSQEFGLSAQH